MVIHGASRKTLRTKALRALGWHSWLGRTKHWHRRYPKMGLSDMWEMYGNVMKKKESQDSPDIHQIFTRYSPDIHQIFTRYSPLSRRNKASQENWAALPTLLTDPELRTHSPRTKSSFPHLPQKAPREPNHGPISSLTQLTSGITFWSHGITWDHFSTKSQTIFPHHSPEASPWQQGHADSLWITWEAGVWCFEDNVSWKGLKSPWNPLWGMDGTYRTSSLVALPASKKTINFQLQFHILSLSHSGEQLFPLLRGQGWVFAKLGTGTLCFESFK